MDSLKSTLSLLKYNIKILLGSNMISAVLLTLLTPFIFSLKLLSSTDMAKIGEIYLSLIGIILITFIGDIEYKDNVWEVIFNRRTKHIYTFAIRFSIMSILFFFMILSINCIAGYFGGSFNIIKMSCGFWITGLFLGSVGLLTSNLTRNVAAGYLIAFGYYGFEFTTKGKYTKNFFLFSLLKDSYYEKYLLTILLILMIFINMVYIMKRVNSNKAG